MADRTSRSATRRTTPQSPPRRTTRSTRSRSIEYTRPGKGRAQSKPLQDLATVAEHSSIPDPNLSQHGVDETDQTAGHGKALPTRPSGTKSPGAASAFSGNTARISGSAPSWVDSDPAEEIDGGTLTKSVKNESANGVQTKPVFRTLSVPLDTALQQNDVPQQPTSNAGRLSNSSTRFNSPKIIQSTAGYLKQTKENRKASGKFQKSTLQSSKAARNVPVSLPANPSHRESAPPANVVNLTTENREEIFEKSQAPTSPRREDGLRPQHGWQDQNVEDSLEPSIGPGEGLDAMARRVKETKAKLEVDGNKENLAELSGPSHSTQGGKKKYFIDPQPNAERIRFDDSQDSQRRTLPSRKRRRQDPEIVLDGGDNQLDTTEVSADEGFQQDRRAISAISKNTRTLAQNRAEEEPLERPRLSPKKTRSVPWQNDFDEEPTGAVTQQDQGEALGPSQFENYKKAKEMAKRNVAVQYKKAQTRTPWSDEETKTLISLIGDHGISWKLLKEQDNGSILKLRDQVALKDKARNMKFEFLKAGPFLPQNFEYVPLNKMQMDKLRGLGIVYDPTTGQRDGGEVALMDTDEE
ncbi:hypothetical protein MMC07_003261 [Pseudocyphellaria aurata]|nr:hypothetical protein [Pseudocyphellaria aurata]